MKRLLILLAIVFSAQAAAFDHQHADWSRLLEKHVLVSDDGYSSQVDYAAFKSARTELAAYLQQLTAVSEAEFGAWTRDRQLAFLINAYNAFTVELILTAYPDIESIRDLGGLFTSPWKKRFFKLLGKERHLDEIEHDMIRAPGRFDEPRIHVAVVCASIGCPMLRPEAFVADKLDEQLEDSMRRFLSDRSRNRFDPAGGTLQLSRIFDWYGSDFEQPEGRFTSLKRSIGIYAEQLADSSAEAQRIRDGDYRIRFLEYDWQLNDTRR